jgi:hypothetical protein
LLGASRADPHVNRAYSVLPYNVLPYISGAR